MMEWTTELGGCPSQSWAFVRVNGHGYGLVLSHRPDSGGWRGFVVPHAQSVTDLWAGLRWSVDVLAEGGLVFAEGELPGAQGALARLLAARLGVAETALEPVRNGRTRRPGQSRVLTAAQVRQMAQAQPRRR